MALNGVAVHVFYSNPNTVPDRAFERAARWGAQEALAIGMIVEVIGITTKQAFIDAWNGILNQANTNHTTVKTCWSTRTPRSNPTISTG